VILLAVSTFFYTDFIAHLGINPGAFPLGAVLSILLAGWFVNRKQTGWAFVMTAVNIVLTQITFFLILFPRVMISSTDPAFSLDIWNAASSPYTLKVMTIVAIIFVPIVLAYQGYTYWVFRKRVTTEKKNLIY
jgi:cytochrome d ubiquinol oxidase subunit II